jgi:aldehyde dehydrogenase (NAD+)
VVGAVIPWNFPLLMLAWKVAPALAAGNTVVLKPAEYTPLTSLLFAQLSVQAGLPKGVLNVVTGAGDTGAALVAHSGVDKIAFTGSTEVGRKIRQATAGTGKALTLELGGKSPYIVFDDADIDSAVEGLVDAIWFNGGQVCCAGSRLLVQEGIADRFYAKLKRRMDGLRVGDPMDKCIDMGAIVHPQQLARITDMVSASAGDIYRAATPIPNGCYYPPTLITGLSTASPLMQEEIFGPVLVAMTFRTPEEAVLLANNTRYGLAASVWSENINLALDIAPKLVAGVVWVNGTNMFDAAAGFGGMRESGFGREGGWEGLLAYLRPKTQGKPLAQARANFPAPTSTEGMDRTAKLFIGGKQARPDGGYSQAITTPKGKLLGEVGIGNRKDVRGAVEAAHAAKSWGKATAHNRAQVIYYIAENLSARADEFARRLNDMGAKHGVAEVDMSIQRLFTYAAWADKYDGAIKPVPLRGAALALNVPVGVIGAICPDEAPLLGLISLMAPAIAMGNTCVLIPSQTAPLAATDFYQVLETSDLPAGVVNIITGDHGELGKSLAGHMDVDAVWSFSSTPISQMIEAQSVGNLKRTWVNNARAVDWFAPAAEGRAFLRAATDVKTVWIPFGE